MSEVKNRLEQKSADKSKRILELQKKRLEEWERDSELVQGVFRYLDSRGGVLKFCLYAYKQDGIQRIELKDGERAELKRYVVRHINNNINYLKYKNLPNDKAIQAVYTDGYQRHKYDDMVMTERVPRCEFIPYNLDPELMPKQQILTVSRGSL